MSTDQSRVIERRTQFAQRWLKRLEGTAARLTKSAQSSEDMKEITKDFHQICGAAGIYELNELCAVAIAAEDLCLTIAAANSPPNSKQLEHLRSSVASIAKLLQPMSGA